MKEIKAEIIRKIARAWQDKKSLPFRLNRYLHRLLISHSNNPRPSSYPYISGDTFRVMAQHIFDNCSIITPDKVKEGDIVFVDICKIQEFFKAIHPKIKNSYKLITHNGDDAISHDLVRFIDDKIIHWYGQNVDVVHPKITAIPIGLENMHYYNNGIVANIKRIQCRKIPKKNKILFGFSIPTNSQERQPAFDILAKIKTTEKLSGWPNAWSYLNTLNSYKFIASPPGNGIDCHRTWEAIYLGVVPIVKESILTKHFRVLGLPMWVINDWRELQNLDADDLENKYHELTGSVNLKPLSFDYWLEQIKNKK
jgi:hypothetical protein